MTKFRSDIRIGISGWRYKGWRGSFYPEDLTQRKELEFASHHFRTIELNGSFYSLQRPQSFQSWSRETPDDFVFSIKGSRFVTHIRRLREIESPLANFFAQGLLSLGKKLGPFLWQFPPNFSFDAERFDKFFGLLPKTQEEASEFSANHDRRMNGRAFVEVEKAGKHLSLRHAIEIRNPSFVCEEFIALLRQHRIALVVADTVEWPRLMDITADFMYCRLHGSEQLYASGYDSDAIDTRAKRVLAWSRGEEVSDGKKASTKNGPQRKSRDVFVYFDNDRKVRAPFDAQSLEKRIADLAAREPIIQTSRAS
jgi:uncharacterized protein YecE (DUF72 family)